MFSFCSFDKSFKIYDVIICIVSYYICYTFDCFFRILSSVKMNLSGITATYDKHFGFVFNCYENCKLSADPFMIRWLDKMVA